MRACTAAVSWQPLLETINTLRHTCAGIQTWNKLQARFAWMMIMIVFKRLQMGIQSTFGKKTKWAISHGTYQVAVQCIRMGEFCSMPHKLGWPYWAVHVWSSYGLDDFQIKLRITDGPLGANKLSAPLRTRHKSCTGVPRFCSEVSFYKDFQIKQFTRPADYRGLTSPSIPVEQEGMP